jgi:hypothetical protein
MLQADSAQQRTVSTQEHCHVANRWLAGFSLYFALQRPRMHC